MSRPPMEVGGKSIRTDDEGYLVEPADGTEEIAGMRRPRARSTG